MRLALAALLPGLLAGAAALQPPAAPPGGEQLYRQQCFACHALAPGADSPAGPTLHAIVGRPVASLPGFNYSPALRRFAERNPRWTAALLDRFLADPDAAVPGNEMGLAGMANPARRRTLIAWLRAPRTGSDR